MDRQNREGSRFGSGGMATDSMNSRFRRERLRQLALETFDVSKDPYMIKNQLGSFECRLCATVHANEGSYMGHTQGRRHQTALQQRAIRDAKLAGVAAPVAKVVKPAPRIVAKIGRPGYRVAKFWEDQLPGLKFDLQFPDIEPGAQPRHSFMSAYEQKVEPPDARYQYLLFAAAPYETVAFKIPSRPMNKERFVTEWDPRTHNFHVELQYVARTTLTS